MAFRSCLAPCGAAVTRLTARREFLAVGHIAHRSDERACAQVAFGDCSSSNARSCSHERLFCKCFSAAREERSGTEGRSTFCKCSHVSLPRIGLIRAVFAAPTIQELGNRGRLAKLQGREYSPPVA